MINQDLVRQVLSGQIVTDDSTYLHPEKTQVVEDYA